MGLEFRLTRMNTFENPSSYQYNSLHTLKAGLRVLMPWGTSANGVSLCKRESMPTCPVYIMTKRLILRLQKAGVFTSK